MESLTEETTTTIDADNMDEQQVRDALILESYNIIRKECTPRVMKVSDDLLDRLLELVPSIKESE